MAYLVLPVIAVGALLSAGLCAALLRFGGVLGLVDRPIEGTHKKHAQPTPCVGGVAIYWAIVLPLLAGALAVVLLPEGAWSGWLSPVAEHMAGLRSRSLEVLGLVGALTLMHIVGLVDDRRGMGPFLKLAAQLFVAAMLAVFFNVRILEALGSWWGPAGVVVSIVLSVLWIGVITNAMNFLDNMNGLAAGVGACIAGLYLIATLAIPGVGGQWFDAALAALLLGALLGFLPFNYPKARMFMGDAGSMVLGLVLAVLSVRVTYYQPEAGPAVGWHALLAPLALLAVPLYDFTSVTLIRMLAGKSPFVGDQNHFSHRLVRKGLSPAVAVAVIWLCTLATGLGGALLPTVTPWQAALVAAQVAAVLTVLALLERTK